MSAVLRVKNLSVALDGRTILHDLNFEVDAGDHLAIIGPNGSGKTVLLKTLLGMYPHEGEVRWEEKIRVGYVPQKIEADRHLPLNARNLLVAKANVLGLPQSEVASVTNAVGLTAAALNTSIGHLSGGQFQKALIAFALVGRPDVILFDEPTASLDQLAEEHVYELLHDLQDRYNITIVLVSHDLSVVSRYATKVLCVNREKICFGTPEEALHPETLAKLYGTPQKYYHHLHAHE